MYVCIYIYLSIYVYKNSTFNSVCGCITKTASFMLRHMPLATGGPVLLRSTALLLMGM
jgi:hypothetical protein